MALPASSPLSTCVVTGASAGIGAELARVLAARGHGVTLVARREDRLRELARELTQAYDVRVEAIACDVGDPQQRRHLANELGERGLAVEVLVNNAGFGSAGRFQSLDPEREAEMVRLNVEAVVALCGSYAPAMVDRGRGAILNVASTAAFQPGPGMAVYFATKAYVLSFSEALHEEVKKHGVIVSALCPGPTATEFGEVAGFKPAGPSAKMLVSMAADSASVVRAGLEGLERNQAVVVPGLANKATAQAHRFFPRSWVRRIAGTIKL